MTLAPHLRVPESAGRSTADRRRRPQPEVVRTIVLGLLVLVLVGIAVGQVVGYLLAAGVLDLLDLVSLGQSN